MDDAEIRSLFGQAKVSLSRSDVWNVQSAKVIRHAALERLAASVGIVWALPTVIHATADSCAVLVSATNPKTKAMEWSIGEARVIAEGNKVGNYRVTGKQAAYPYAMAEKRGKDRVIIKLVGLHGVYSEEEADDFKVRQSAPPPAERQAQADRGRQSHDRRDASQDRGRVSHSSDRRINR